MEWLIRLQYGDFIIIICEYDLDADWIACHVSAQQV